MLILLSGFATVLAIVMCLKAHDELSRRGFEFDSSYNAYKDEDLLTDDDRKELSQYNLAKKILYVAVMLNFAFTLISLL